MNINAINVAIRLGDPVLPPKGAKIKTADGAECEVVDLCAPKSVHDVCTAKLKTDSFDLESGWMKNGNREWSGDLEGFRVYGYLVPGTTYEVLELPDPCPPFELWYRPNYELREATAKLRAQSLMRRALHKFIPKRKR